MKYGADYGLDEYQIAERDQLIEDIKQGLRNFEEAYGLDLPLARFERPLEPGIPSNVVYDGRQPVYDEAWVRKKRDYIFKELLDYLAKLIVRTVATMGRNDDRLIGSSYAVALKLCTSHPVKHEVGFTQEEDGFRLRCDTGKLGLTFQDIVGRVCDEYEQKYKTYRLWDDHTLKLLAQYLFRGAWDSTVFQQGALWTQLSSEGEPVALEQFIEAVDEALLNLPMKRLTEASFPDYSGVVFSAYIPAENMSPAQKEALYRQYVDILAR
ncbi:hypothetical protein [Pseudomonas sp. NPDC089547]|uniref:hypothetical protein n=1 Tax=Pseudomonas sp. NPDC089547 TaxID=3390652 RepID=UPI003D06FBAC